MSQRYEWIEARYAAVVLRLPGEQVDGSDEADAATQVEDYAVVLGNPYATALVVTGSPDQLRAFADRVRATVPAEQPPGAGCDAEDRCRTCGAHIAEPHAPDCPTGAGLDHDDGLSGPAAGRDTQVVWSLSAADLDRIAGRTLTDDELDRIGRAVGHSSIPAALEVVVDAIAGSTTEEDGR
jgi:hypothetical protein